MPILDTCCGCAPLKTGAIAIGVLEVVGIILEVFGGGINSKTIAPFLLALACAGCLIYGAIKAQRYYLVPWLVRTLLIIIGIFIGLIVLTFASSIIEDAMRENGGNSQDIDVVQFSAGFVAVVLLIFLGLELFFLLVIYSHYVELRDGESSHAIQDPKVYYPSAPA